MKPVAGITGGVVEMANEIFERGLIFVSIYLIIWAAITSTVNTAFADAWDSVTCPGPDYELGYDEACAPFTHPDPYSEDAFVVWNATGAWYSGGSDWVASIPTGWAVYTAHVLAHLFFQGGSALFAIVTLFVVPELTLYGQTVDASALAWLNGGLFMFAIFGVIALGKGWL